MTFWNYYFLRNVTLKTLHIQNNYKSFMSWVIENFTQLLQLNYKWIYINKQLFLIQEKKFDTFSKIIILCYKFKNKNIIFGNIQIMFK